MNRCGKIAIGLVGGLALNMAARADDVVLPGDPYATVVARNIFGLNPPPQQITNPQDANPPVKITPNGIMTIFGEVQVLFKVAGTPKPGGSPPADESYILSEGQRQDDIEVVKIDEKNSIVTFNNHGETQELPLVVTQPSSTPSPSLAGGPGVGGPGAAGGRFSPGFVNPGGGPGARARGNGGGGGYGGSGAYGGGGANSGGQGNSGNANGGSNLSNVPTRNNTFNAASQIPEGLTPEVQTIAIEANRALGGETAQILPITEMTPQTDPATPP
jgi:hypothetical protein